MSASHSLPISTPLAAQAERIGVRPAWWLTLRRSSRTLIGLAIVLAVTALTLLAPAIDRYDPTFGDFDNLLAGPSRDHFFGTDNFGRDVFARVLYGYRVSLVVGVASVAAAVAVGLPLGLLAGYFGNLVDNLIMRPLDLLMSFPAILLAITLVAVFGTKTQVTVLALAHTPLIMRFARSTMLEVIRQDYVTTARAKGLAERVVLMRHAFRNALIPLITVIGMGLPELFSGAVITETIFQWPGMGLLTVRAVHARDYPLILGAIMVTATAVLVSNLIADLLYAAADPRINYE